MQKWENGSSLKTISQLEKDFRKKALIEIAGKIHVVNDY